MLPYERLVVWKDAHALAIDCFRVSARWPDYWLQRQLRRASESVAANLVEGSSHLSNAEFARFIGLALGSAREAGYHLRFACDVGVLDAKDANPLVARFDGLAARLHRLRTSVRRGAARRGSPAPCRVNRPQPTANDQNALRNSASSCAATAYPQG